MDEHRHAALHVERAAPPHVAVDKIAGERRARPLLSGRRNDIDVTLQEQRRLRAAGQSRHEVGALRCFRIDGAVDSDVREQRADEVDARRFVARRVRRVEADQLL